MWLWILLITALIAAAFIFTVSWMLVKLVITPERSSLEEVEQLEIERGNFAPGEMAAMLRADTVELLDVLRFLRHVKSLRRRRLHPIRQLKTLDAGV